ncbi:MAG: hypothetical protein RIS35_2497 [Pseudomonadota bacterium]
MTPFEDGWGLAIHAQPGAKRTEIVGIVEARLKVRLAAPPVEGKANEALLRWVADRLGLPMRAIEIVSGQTSRRKRLRVRCGLEAVDLMDRLDPDHQGRRP